MHQGLAASLQVLTMGSLLGCSPSALGAGSGGPGSLGRSVPERPLDLPMRPDRVSGHSALRPGLADSGPPLERIGEPRSIEDPEGRGLAAFLAALGSLERGEARGHVRVLHYGDSHVAADLYTNEVRRALQQRFGVGGQGFVLPGKPWPTYRHAEVNLGALGSWRSQRGRVGPDEPGSLLLGLGGVALSSSDPQARTWLATTSDPGPGDSVARFDVFFLRSSKGGGLEIRVDGQPLRSVSTRTGPRESTGLGMETVVVPEGPHRLELSPRGDGELSLLGVVMERQAPGLVYDTLGINGAQALTPLLWEPALWAAQLRQREPDLVILAYGANEAGAQSFDAHRYYQAVQQLVRRLREAVPRASCLLLAPCDRAAQDPDGQWRTLVTILEVVEVQRRVARQEGCAFWNAFAAMGGRGSINEWAGRVPALARQDRVHLSAEGYRGLAMLLRDALLDAYARFVAAQCADKSYPTKTSPSGPAP